MANRLRFRRLIVGLVGVTAAVMFVRWLRHEEQAPPSVTAQDAAPAGYKTYSLRNGEAAEIAPKLRDTLRELFTDVDVLIDRQNNRILVEGSPEAQRMATQLVETLDRPSQRNGAANADEPNVVRGYRVTEGDIEVIANELREKYPAANGVKIAVDKRTRQVIVVGPNSIQKQVAQQLNVPGREQGGAEPSDGREPSPANNAGPRLAPPATAAAPDSPAKQLRNISWKELEDGFRRVWGNSAQIVTGRNGELATIRIANQQNTPAIVQVDRRRDQVSFAGTADVQRSLEQLVDVMDRAGPRQGQDTRIVPLEKADLTQVKRAVNTLQASFGQPGNDNVTATIPRRAATRQPNDGEMIARVIQDDEPKADPNAKPKPANAEPAARPGADPAKDKNKEQASDDDDDTGVIGNVQIEILEGLDVIVVRGKKKDVERVTKLINDIERLSTETKPEIRIYALKHVSSAAMADLVLQVYDQILSSRNGRVSVTALVKPNALLLVGRMESVEVVLELVQKLDQPVEPTAQLQVFPLKYMSAVDAENTVRNFFSQTTTPRTGTGTQAPQAPQAPQGQQGGANVASSGANLAPRVHVVSDFRSNAIIVQASPRDLEEVGALLKQIDVEANAATSELRVFKLTNSVAAEIAPILQAAVRGQAVTGQPGGQGNQGANQFGAGAQNQQQQRSTALQLVTVDTDGNKIISSGIPGDVVVTADPTANAIVVRAPSKSMELISALIGELDQLPSAESQIKVFTIVNGDATNMTGVLQQLFGQQVTAGRGSGGLFGQQAALFGAAGLQGAQAGGGLNTGESTLVPLRFSTDVRTNSILASGSASDLNVVETIILRLDEGDVATRKTTVYRLKNSFAQDVATAITTFLNNQLQVNQQNQIFNQAVGPYEQLERQIFVVAEPLSNSVIISATPQYYENIMKVVQELDFRPPMVMVQVLIAEVQLSDFYELGLEMGLQDSLLFDRGKAALAAANPAAVPGFNFNNVGLPNVNSLVQSNVAGQGISSFGVGRSNSTLGYGGLVLSAASDSVNVLFRALQDRNRMQVLSRPEIVAIHNRQARILVGEKVPRVRGSSVSQNGNTSNVEDVDVGLILNIIPQINDDGIVILSVQAEKSALGPVSEAVQIGTSTSGQPVLQQRIRNTSAYTTISAKDGQTVIFAGLITLEKSVVVRGVPYLSDLPLIGRMFDYTQDSEVRKELLIVMTPKIVKHDEDYDWIKATESSRMNWCLGDVVNLHGDVGLRGNNCLFCNSRIPTCFPDQDPTGSEVIVDEFDGFHHHQHQHVPNLIEAEPSSSRRGQLPEQKPTKAAQRMHPANLSPVQPASAPLPQKSYGPQNPTSPNRVPAMQGPAPAPTAYLVAPANYQNAQRR